MGPQVRVSCKTAKKPLGISAPFLSSDSPRSFVYPESLQNIKRAFGFPAARCSVDINCTAQLKSRDQGSLSVFFLMDYSKIHISEGRRRRWFIAYERGENSGITKPLYKQIKSLQSVFSRPYSAITRNFNLAVQWGIAHGQAMRTAFAAHASTCPGC